jgi:hypothetical protein
MHRTLFAITLALAACGTQTGQGSGRDTTATAAPGTGTGSDVECHDEAVIGSNVPRHVCRSKAQSDLDRDGAQNWQARPAATPTSAK